MDPADAEQLLSGWSFTVEEVSAGVYRVRGVAQSGRSVETTGTDPNALLVRCQRDAIRIARDMSLMEPI
jgi:hypothetical protein